MRSPGLCSSAGVVRVVYCSTAGSGVGVRVGSNQGVLWKHAGGVHFTVGSVRVSSHCVAEGTALMLFAAVIMECAVAPGL